MAVVSSVGHAPPPPTLSASAAVTWQRAPASAVCAPRPLPLARSPAVPTISPRCPARSAGRSSSSTATPPFVRRLNQPKRSTASHGHRTESLDNWLDVSRHPRRLHDGRAAGPRREGYRLLGPLREIDHPQGLGQDRPVHALRAPA